MKKLRHCTQPSHIGILIRFKFQSQTNTPLLLLFPRLFFLYNHTPASSYRPCNRLRISPGNVHIGDKFSMSCNPQSKVLNCYRELILFVYYHTHVGRDGWRGVLGDICTKPPPLQPTQVACACNSLVYDLVRDLETYYCRWLLPRPLLKMPPRPWSLKSRARFYYSVTGISLASWLASSL